MEDKKTNVKEFWNEIIKLKDKRLISIVAVDEKDYFNVNYFFEIEKNVFKLAVKLDKKESILPSIHSLFPSAIYYECEVHDFFGIEFEGIVFA